MDFAEGRIVLVLEGGYSPAANAASMQACIEGLLAKECIEEISNIAPSTQAINVTLQVYLDLVNFLSFWK